VGTKVTRRRFLRAVSAGLTYVALTSAAGCAPRERTPMAKTPEGRPLPTPAEVWPLPNASSAPSEGVWSFRSQPDLRPPAVEVATQTRDTASGYIFVAPKAGVGQDGPMIVDDRGQVVWFRPMHIEGVQAMNFKEQSYRGEPVLTWWQGRLGFGECMILDSSYREIGRVRPGNGYRADIHEFLITPQNTALLTAYNPVPRDLSSVGGPEDGVLVDGIVQEVDIETGEVLFEWHSLDHVGLGESYRTLSDKYLHLFFPTTKVFDYFHLNSIDVDHDSNLLISARNTFTVYKIDRKSGEIMWRLGGKKSDFEMGLGTRTAWQHDARRQPDGTITIFDNGGLQDNQESYGLVVELDMDEMSATLVRKYAYPGKLLAATMGNMQALPNGDVFIGWGSQPYFSEFGEDGRLLFDARFSAPNDESYRAFRFPWSAHPTEDPAVVVERGPEDEKPTLYASWNGATELASWEVLAGPGPGRLESLGSVPRDGFETAITAHTAEPYLAVRAQDGSGRVLGSSEAREVG
jgi:hypothetical protein